jgi:hypothetical protein
LQIRSSKVSDYKSETAKDFPGADCKSETAKETAKVDLDMLITNPQ